MVWEFFHDSESDRWIAVSDTLQLTVEGKTHAEMRQMIDETTGLLLADLYESGELNTFLDDRGFRRTSMPTPSPQQRIQFDVPFELIRQANDKQEGRVKKKSQAIKERVRRGARQTSGNLT